MFTHCLSCSSPLPESAIPHERVRGDFLAYDPARGRLWSICRRCRSWNLAPMEERWEALEKLEGIATRYSRAADRPRLITRTDNIALFESGRLRFIRVGETNRVEEACWRYGRQLQDHWKRERRLSVGGAATVGAAIVGGILTATLPARYAFRSPGEVRRWLTFGDSAWTGQKACQGCGHVITELSFFDRKILRLHRPRGGSAHPVISRRCPGCGDADEGGLQLTGLEAEQTMRRVLAYQHHPAVTERQLRDAADLIEREGNAARLASVLIRHTRQLGDLQPAATAALEIATNEAHERLLLRFQIDELEEYWHSAEELAAIVDGELTPVSRIELLRTRVFRPG